MFRPVVLAALWLGVAIAFALLVPVIAFLGKLGGGLLGVAGSAVLAASGLCIVAYSCIQIVRLRPAMAAGAAGLLTPILAVFLGALMCPVLAELSWQAINGPRDVPIWPYG
jgi:hypothetical protein